ncbi:uncharacterized protein LOC120339458 [Styela clava]
MFIAVCFNALVIVASVSGECRLPPMEEEFSFNEQQGTWYLSTRYPDFPLCLTLFGWHGPEDSVETGYRHLGISLNVDGEIKYAYAKDNKYIRHGPSSYETLAGDTVVGDDPVFVEVLKKQFTGRLVGNWTVITDKVNYHLFFACMPERVVSVYFSRPVGNDKQYYDDTLKLVYAKLKTVKGWDDIKLSQQTACSDLLPEAKLKRLPESFAGASLPVKIAAVLRNQN